MVEVSTGWCQKAASPYCTRCKLDETWTHKTISNDNNGPKPDKMVSQSLSFWESYKSSLMSIQSFRFTSPHQATALRARAPWLQPLAPCRKPYMPWMNILHRWRWYIHFRYVWINISHWFQCFEDGAGFFPSVCCIHLQLSSLRKRLTPKALLCPFNGKVNWNHQQQHNWSEQRRSAAWHQNPADGLVPHWHEIGL